MTAPRSASPAESGGRPTLASRRPAPYNMRVDACPECGNRDLRTVTVTGGSIVECGLCGERFGSRQALQALADFEEADRQGYAAEVWPLVRVALRLAGVGVDFANAGGPERGPAVGLALGTPRALGQIENLARLLRLAAGELRLTWRIEVEAERQLTFVLRPRLRGDFSAAALREAHLDLATLARELDRNRQLQWWQRAERGR